MVEGVNNSTHLKLSTSMSFAGGEGEPFRIPKIEMVENSSLVMLHCIFTMYRVYSISQW